MKSQQEEERFQRKKQLMANLLRRKRQRVADNMLIQILQKDQYLLKGMHHNKFGGVCLNCNQLEKAQKHLIEAKQIINPRYAFSNIFMNLGNLEAQRKNYEAAIKYYQETIRVSPYSRQQSLKEEDQILFSTKLNNYEAYVDAHTNLAVMYVQLQQFQKGFSFCEKALVLKPGDHNSTINFTDILRQLGKQKEAIQITWDNIVKLARQTKPQYKAFTSIQIHITDLTIKPVQPLKKINILTVKWGTRYGADYVNKLYSGIQRNTSWEFDFYCLTDNGEGLNPKIIVKELQKGWERWWGKVTLFNLPIEGRKFYIDLDMVIVGNLDELFSYPGKFTTLRSGDLACQKNHKDGYNSSVMIWQDETLKPVYTELKQNFQSVTKYIVRFDFWLQMTINKAQFVQELYPGKVIDYLADAQKQLPKGSSVVCFARKPKPQDYPAEWIRQYWVE